MQTIGEKLEEARKRKGISVREAAETTKIRGDYLQKFEANSFDLDLPPLYIRGFLRSYARYLDLDAERFLAEYDSVMAAEGRTPRRESREVYGRVEFGEGGVEAPAVGRSAQDQAVMLKFGLLIGGAIVAIIVIILLINVLFFRAPAQSAATMDQASVQMVRPANSSEATFTVTAVDSTRVKVAYFDNSNVFLDGKFPMNRGEMKTIRYTKDLIVTVEYPERIRIELNGGVVDVPTKQPMGQFRVPFVAPR
jgi:cytoskeletal protein RodZ